MPGGRSGCSGNRQWRKTMGAAKQAPRCRRHERTPCKSPPQSITNKSRSKSPSRYTENKVLFSVPCVYVREAFFVVHFWPFRGITARHRQGVSRCRQTSRRGVAIMNSLSDARGFSGGLRPGGVFSPAFLVKRGHFSLKKWKRMAYYFNLVF